MSNRITNAELYEALRKVGLEEADALRLAKAVPPAETIVTKAELESGLNDVRAEIRVAKALASEAEVKVLRADVDATKGGIERLAAEVNRRFDDAERFDPVIQEMNRGFDYLDTAMAKMLVESKVVIGLLLVLVGLKLWNVFFG